jgi:predicted CoA-binding protein
MDPDDRLRLADLLDLQEGRGPVRLLDDAGIAAVLRAARRIAIVGASPDPTRPSHDVMRYLVHEGYDCVPIHPTAPDVLGIRAFRTLREAVGVGGAVDIVDVFRRPESCPAHAEEAVAVRARCLWLQLGVVSWEAARIAAAGGLSVVMDRCTAIEHRRLGGRQAT